MNSGAAHRFPMLVQQLHSPGHDMARHAAVDFIGKTDEAGFEAIDL